MTTQTKTRATSALDSIFLALLMIVSFGGMWASLEWIGNASLGELGAASASYWLFATVFITSMCACMGLFTISFYALVFGSDDT